MKVRYALLVSVMALGLFGCASNYGSESWTGGYYEKQLEPTVWRIVYSGNGYTTPETVQTFWLYRSAEITLEQGYDDFEILSDVKLSSTDGKHRATLVHGGGGGGGGMPIYIYDTAKPSFEADIKLIKKPFAVQPPKSFDAAILKAALEPHVRGKLCDSGNVCPHPHIYLSSSK